MYNKVYLLSDFGLLDYYVAAMKTVILDHVGNQVIFIDVSHSIEPGNILQGSFILWQLSLLGISDSIVVGVVDPGVGTDRDAIVVKCEGENLLVGPDNGLLYPLSVALGVKKIYRINYLDKKYFPRVTHTFHGRDVFAKVAGLLLSGFYDFLEEKNSMIENDIFDYRRVNNELVFKVLHIDNFGNIITNVPCDIDIGDRIELFLGSSKGYVLKKVDTFSDLEPGEIGIICGSSGLYEIVCNLCSAAERIGCRLSSVGKLKLFT